MSSDILYLTIYQNTIFFKHQNQLRPMSISRRTAALTCAVPGLLNDWIHPLGEIFGVNKIFTFQKLSERSF